MSSVKTLVLAFIGQYQQQQTCVVTLLKSLSTCCCAGLHWLISAIMVKIIPVRRDNDDVYPFLKALLQKKSDLVVGVNFTYCNGEAVVVHVLYSSL